MHHVPGKSAKFLQRRGMRNFEGQMGVRSGSLGVKGGIRGAIKPAKTSHGLEKGSREDWSFQSPGSHREDQKSRERCQKLTKRGSEKAERQKLLPFRIEMPRRARSPQ